VKNYEKLFAIIYCLVMFGCIVFRVESWPFSDWRVYSGRMMPRFVIFHEVIAEVEGKPTYPLKRGGLALTVNDMFNNLSQKGSPDDLQQLCDKVTSNIFLDTQVEKVVINRYQLNGSMEIISSEVCSRYRPDRQ
jgi:hypothetical protein